MILHKILLGINHANCYIIVDENSGNSTVIDPGGFENKLVELLKIKKIDKIKYILMTHGHYDHILGAYDLKTYSGARVAIHKNDAGCLMDEQSSLASYAVGQRIQKYLKPDILLEDGMILELGETNLRVLFTPGHTKGGVCFVCERGQKIFTGDTLFYHDAGRTDLPGGSMPELLHSLSRIRDLKGDYSVYPGHDRESTLSDERLNNAYMRKHL